MNERAQLGDLKNLYVFSSQGRQRVPLSQVAKTTYEIRTERILRRNRFRTITVSAKPSEGGQASEVVSAAQAGLDRLKGSSLPAGFTLEVGGEREEQSKGFRNLVVVLIISVIAIFLVLVVQFRSAVKPFLVFAAVPYGIVGSLFALWGTGEPFGFMAFLGIVSLIGVIVSHVIVLFDFVEEKHAEGEPLREALLDAGIMRLRPRDDHRQRDRYRPHPAGDARWPALEGMCYAQIGGLTAATFVTLLLVPVLYSIVVLDLKLIK